MDMDDYKPVHPSKIHKGDILWESSQYGNIQFEVVDEPVHNVDKWEWQGKTARRGVIDYLVVDGYGHYGPHIYKQPVYMHPDSEYLNEEK